MNKLRLKVAQSLTIDNDTIIQDSTCKVLITRGKVFVSKSSINVPPTPATAPAILENASVITSEIKSSTIKDSDICKSSVRYSKGIIDTTVQSSSFEYAFIKSGIIKKDSDCINYHNFGSSELNITIRDRNTNKLLAVYVPVGELETRERVLLTNVKSIKITDDVVSNITGAPSKVTEKIEVPVEKYFNIDEVVKAYNGKYSNTVLTLRKLRKVNTISL